VAVVDERMARDLWPGMDPIGKRVRTAAISSSAPWITVIGVVGSVKQYTLESDSRIAMYLSERQYPRRAMNVVLRTGGSPEALAAPARAALKAFDPDVPMYNVRTMTDRVAASLAQRRFAMQLLALFALVALVLAIVGIYGVISYLVSQGTRELGIRLALGASRSNVVWLVGRQSVAIAMIGVTLGVQFALAITRFMQSLLFGIDAADPMTFASIATLLTAVALAAAFIPARRAARIDPAISLRSE
jgi:predicted lysophospholipase L1 biosynthesis ABC-type transport system permease subunit